VPLAKVTSLVPPSGGAGVANGLSYEVLFRDGRPLVQGTGPPLFAFLMRDPAQYEWLLRSDLYSAALAFVRGDFDVRGDLISAIRFKKEIARGGLRDWVSSMRVRWVPRRIESWIQTRLRAARNVRFHYDRSNDFYRSFLDSRMVYSSADFNDSNQDIDDAQLAKLDHICGKLALQPGERFLDIGCGWGALIARAAEQYGVSASGCTLSPEQRSFAAKSIAEKHLERRVMVNECDYRSLTGRFNKIASIGMFEHVGRRRLREYFRKVFDLLEDDGLFLNRGIIRPEGAKDGPETLFLDERVFPGGELATLSTVTHEAGRAGFEVLEVENLRLHYALTCRRWVERLQKNRDKCLRYVELETYRTWLLYLAASAVNFQEGVTDLYQILMAKRRPSGLRFAGSAA
jgi:cyclopropane-fatty-acyl-phospholipid synthase